MPTILGDVNKREPFLLADDDESAPSTPQDSADSTLRGIGNATEYVVLLATQRLRNLSPFPRDVLLAIGKIRDSHSNVWPSLSRFALVGRRGLLTAAVVT